MPTYEYACRQCGHRFEQMQSITAKALKKCPSCGKNTLQRLFGAGAGFIFKGSGFYATDHKSPSGARTTAYSKTSEGESKPAPSEKTEKAPVEKKSEE